jgi:cell shape-determining protein MreD
MINKRRARRFVLKNDRLRVFLRWFSYTAVLVLFYMVMAGGFFRTWQPILIIPLAMAVSMRESELSASIFGAVCGLFIDIACGKLFGFSGIWLMPGCLLAALLVSHLIKTNLINFIWLNAVVCAFMAVTDYFLRYVLWSVDNAAFIFTRYILPSHILAIILSPGVYFMVKLISLKLSKREVIRPSASANNEEDYLK